MTAAFLLGAATGLGLTMILYGWRPARPALGLALERLRYGARARRWSPAQAVQRDLAILDKPVERYLAEKAAGAVVLGLIPAAAAAVLAMTGMALPFAVPAWACLLGGVAGFFVPNLALRSEANKRRADFRHALSAFLDLTVISLAGGAGVDGALDDASASTGSAFARIRGTLEAARLARRTPWTMLGRLGEDLGVTELVELAANVELAGTEGAKIRSSLQTKAAGLREHLLAASESAALSASERMSLPVVGLFAGFLLFVGYPAVANVLSGI